MAIITSSRKLVPQRGLEAREAPRVLRREPARRPRNRRSSCLGTVVLEHALGRSGMRRDQGDRRRDPRPASRSPRRRTRSGSVRATGWRWPGAGRRGRPAKSSANTIVPAHAPPMSCFPSSSGGILSGTLSAREADLERLRERDHAAHDLAASGAGGASSRRRTACRSPRSRPSPPPSSRRRRRRSCSADGLPDGHGPRGDAADHHALEHGLAAEGRPWSPRGPFRGHAVHGVGGTHRPHRIGAPAARAQPLSRLRDGRDRRSSARARCRRLRSQQWPSRGLASSARAGGTQGRGSTTVRACGSSVSETVSTTSPSTVSLTGTAATAASPWFCHERLVARHPSHLPRPHVGDPSGEVGKREPTWRQRGERRWARRSSAPDEEYQRKSTLAR